MKLSVLMITYNHEPFIAQAIESVLMQRVSFGYEVIIGEDCSTDGTRDIIASYQRRHSNLIKLLPSERNLGMHKNFVRALDACRGQYVALLEGDDYWTSPDKLQKQVEYLDAHPECAISFHNVVAFHEDKSAPAYNIRPDDQKEISTLKDLLKENIVPTCSAMFRRGLIGQLPAWFYDLEMGDYPLHVLNARHGSIGYIGEVLAAYRFHAGGVWSPRSLAARLESLIKAYDKLSDHLGDEYRPVIKAVIADHCYVIAEESAGHGDIECARRHIKRCIYERLAAKCKPKKPELKLWLTLNAPKLFRIVLASKRVLRGGVDTAA